MGLAGIFAVNRLSVAKTFNNNVLLPGANKPIGGPERIRTVRSILGQAPLIVPCFLACHRACPRLGVPAVYTSIIIHYDGPRLK
jgi:hypothetical protein